MSSIVDKNQGLVSLGMGGEIGMAFAQVHGTDREHGGFGIVVFAMSSCRRAIKMQENWP